MEIESRNLGGIWGREYEKYGEKYGDEKYGDRRDVLQFFRLGDNVGVPQITAKGNILGKLEWEISGCCEKLRDEAQKALSRK